MVFDIPIFGILALYLDFEGARNIHVLYFLVFNAPMIRILALYPDFEGAKTSMTFKSSFGALEDAGGS